MDNSQVQEKSESQASNVVGHVIITIMKDGTSNVGVPNNFQIQHFISVIGNLYEALSNMINDQKKDAPTE